MTRWRSFASFVLRGTPEDDLRHDSGTETTLKLCRTDVVRIRNRAYRHGFVVRKAREKRIHPRNLGGIQISDAKSGQILAGDGYALDTEEADEAIDRLLAEGRGYSAK